jgi:cardiolipin synthase
MWRALRRALLLLLIAALFVATALLVAQDQETMRVRSDIAADDRRDAAYVAALVGAALTRGNRYEVLTNGDRIFPSMLAAIDGARRRINFETYVYDSGEVANRFT